MSKKTIPDYSISQMMSDRIITKLEDDKEGRFDELERLEEELHEKQNEQDLQQDDNNS